MGKIKVVPVDNEAPTDVALTEVKEEVKEELPSEPSEPPEPEIKKS